MLIGTGVLSLLALAGGVTTLATTRTQAQSPNDLACAQQDQQPDGSEAEGPDTDNVELECGDQNETAGSSDASESGEKDDDAQVTAIPSSTSQ